MLPWEERDKRIRDRVERYVGSRQHSTTWQEAIAEGWVTSLNKYVKACANYQAHYLEEQNMPIDSHVFLGHPSDNEYYSWKCRQKELCAHGDINVGIPTGHIQHWRDATTYIPPKEKPLTIDSPVLTPDKTFFTNRDLWSKKERRFYELWGEVSKEFDKEKPPSIERN